MPKKAGNIIASKRREFSLKRLEEITGMNRSSILRYQRNEARIPEHVAEKLAHAFYKRKADIEKFIELCRRDYELTEKQHKDEKRRRAERAHASRELNGVIRVVFAGPDEQVKIEADKITFPRSKKVTVHDVHFEVVLISKKSGKPLCSLAAGEGIRMYSGFGCEPGTISPAQLLVFQSRRRPRIGKYALLDIMRRTVERSDVFSFGVNDDDSSNEKLVVIRAADLEAERERLKLLAKEFNSMDGSDVAEVLDLAVAHMQFWALRPLHFKKEQKALLKEIDAFSRRIAAL